jgi:hypothetical protein
MLESIPGGDSFPTPDQSILTDPEVSARYIEPFKEILSYPKELVYCDAYYHSSYYQCDFAERSDERLDRSLVPVFCPLSDGPER